MSKIRVLYICSSMNAGGVETLMFNYIQSIKKIDEDFYADVGCYSFENGIYRQKYEGIGCKVFKIPSQREPIKSFFALNKIIKDGKYDIVHINMSYMSLLPLLSARFNNIKVSISHYHLAFYDFSLFRKISNWFICRLSDYVFGCSKDSLSYLKPRKSYIIKNAIPFDKFLFNKEKRDILRKRMGISENEKCIGLIGRLTDQKNPVFALEILKEIRLKKTGYKMVFVGGGELEENLKTDVIKLNLMNDVIFVGAVPNPEDYYNAFDLFLFPSKYEGLGIVALEAQVNGLNVLASSNVPNEVDCTRKVVFLDLDKGYKFWSDFIISNDCNRFLPQKNSFYESGYILEPAAEYLYCLYQKLLDKNI